MGPIDELKKEHQAVLTALRILEEMASKGEGRVATESVQDIEQLIGFFKVFVDQCHHGKEEKLLFPALEEIGVSREGGPIGVMLAEHDLGRLNISGMLAALRKIKSGDNRAAGALKESAVAYVDLLRRHIEKEDNVLFPIAAAQFSDETLAHLEIDFERLEKEEIGPGRHEEYHAMLDRLQEKYLKQ
jgi:hemerythrin-like domain-containing protein